MRDVDLEPDELSVGAARRPWCEQRDTDSQRAAVQHVLQVARRRVSGERQGRQCDRRYWARHASSSVTPLQTGPSLVGSAALNALLLTMASVEYDPAVPQRPKPTLAQRVVGFAFIGAFGLTMLTVVLTGLYVRSPGA